MAQKFWMITGASRGFGAEIAKSVLEAGDRLVATARNTKGLDIFAGNPNVLSVDLERLYRTNVFGLLNVTRAVLPGMRRQRAGHIINFSFLGGYSSGAGFGVYCSTKFAVEGS